MVKRIWFQFTRKVHDEREIPDKAAASDNEKSPAQAENIPDVKTQSSGSDWVKPQEQIKGKQLPDESTNRPHLPTTDTNSRSRPITPEIAARIQHQDRSAAKDGVLLRLGGSLWIHPAGEYRKIAITAERDIKSRSATALPTVLPAGIHLDVGEMRWLGGHMTAVHEETRAELSPDLPFSATAVIRHAYMALDVGELIFRPPGEGDVRRQPVDEPFAWGSGLLRQTQIYGTFFDERFHIEQLELERLQLIQGEQAWVGQLAQTVGAAFEGAAGRALVQQVRSVPSFADPLAMIRRIAQRHARSIQAK